MINLNVNGKTIKLDTHTTEQGELYKAQDLLKGYGMDVEQSKTTLANWKRSPSPVFKGVNFTPLTIKGKYGGTYLTKHQILKLASYVDYAFEDAVYDAFEALTEGRIKEAQQTAVNAVVDDVFLNAVQDHWHGFYHDVCIGTLNCTNYRVGSQLISIVLAKATGCKTVADLKEHAGLTQSKKLTDAIMELPNAREVLVTLDGALHVLEMMFRDPMQCKKLFVRILELKDERAKTNDKEYKEMISKQLSKLCYEIKDRIVSALEAEATI